MEVTTTLAFRLFSSESAVTTCRVPVQPSGWPMALWVVHMMLDQEQDRRIEMMLGVGRKEETYIAPPRTFTFSMSRPSSFTQ